MQISHASSRGLETHRVRAGTLWFAVLCGPLAAFADEQVEYFLVAWSCGKFDPVSRILLHAVPLSLIVLCAAAALVAWKARTTPTDASEEHIADADRSRRGFMALLALGLNLLGVVVILSQWIPVFYLSPCLIT